MYLQHVRSIQRTRNKPPKAVDDFIPTVPCGRCRAFAHTAQPVIGQIGRPPGRRLTTTASGDTATRNIVGFLPAHRTRVLDDRCSVYSAM